MEIETPRSLLVLKPSSFGDIVHTLPAVARLRAAWPRCRVSWVANTEWMPLLDGNPVVDEVIEFPRRAFRGWGGGGRMWRWLQATMAGRRPDLALDFQGLLRTALIGRWSGARLFAGLGDAREGARWFYHRVIAPPPQPVHAVERYLTLANSVVDGCFAGGASSPVEPGNFPLPDGRPLETAGDLADDFVLVHPFARGKGKSLSCNEIKGLLREIRPRQTVLVGRGEFASSNDAGGPLNLLNRTTIPELIWLVRCASFVLSVDSGPAHLAAALGRPMVAIHAWSDPRKVGPHRGDAWVWKNGGLTQVRRLPEMGAAFFESKPLRLENRDLAAMAALATSPSDFSA